MSILKRCISVLSLLLSISLVSLAQHVTVVEQEETIENVGRKGMSTIILLEKDVVEKDWIKKLK